MSATKFHTRIFDHRVQCKQNVRILGLPLFLLANICKFLLYDVGVWTSGTESRRSSYEKRLLIQSLWNAVELGYLQLFLLCMLLDLWDLYCVFRGSTIKSGYRNLCSKLIIYFLVRTWFLHHEFHLLIVYSRNVAAFVFAPSYKLSVQIRGPRNAVFNDSCHIPSNSTNNPPAR